MPTLAHRLAEYAVGLEFERLPEAVVHEVKRRIRSGVRPERWTRNRA